MVLARQKAVGSEYYTQHNASPDLGKAKKPARNPFWLFRVAPAIGLIGLIFLIGLGLVAQHAVINYLGHQIGNYNREIVRLDMENEKLKLEISALSALGRIEEVAKTQLGMVQPDNIKYVITDFNSSENNFVQIAGFHSFSQKPAGEEVSQNTILGIIHDFIFKGNISLE